MTRTSNKQVAKQVTMGERKEKGQAKGRELGVRNRRLALRVFFFGALMLGLSFASVPLYDLFCRATGFGGTTQKSSLRELLGLTKRAEAQTISVRFDGNVNGLDWRFAPSQVEMEVTLGELYETFYTAENLSSRALAGVATYNVTPAKAGAYFHKIECFCFVEQTLRGKEKVAMKVVFFLDPALRDHEEWDTFDTVTLSYSFFPQALGDVLDD